jgi:hypothetical protein
MLHPHTTIRAANPSDDDGLVRLADAGNARRLHGRVLIAEVDDGLVAAIEVATGAVIADQSFRSAVVVHAVTLLRRHRYLVLRQAGGGAQVRSLFRREAARLAA